MTDRRWLLNIAALMIAAALIGSCTVAENRAGTPRQGEVAR